MEARLKLVRFLLAILTASTLIVSSVLAQTWPKDPAATTNPLGGHFSNNASYSGPFTGTYGGTLVGNGFTSTVTAGGTVMYQFKWGGSAPLPLTVLVSYTSLASYGGGSGHCNDGIPNTPDVIAVPGATGATSKGTYSYLLNHPQTRINVYVTPNATGTGGPISGGGDDGGGSIQGSVTIAINNVSVFAPPPPTKLKAVSYNQMAALTWNASAGADSYNVYGADGPQMVYGDDVANGIANWYWIPFQHVKLLANVTSTSYTATGLQNDQYYYYVVTACKSGSESYYSNCAVALPYVNPQVPQGGSNTFPWVGHDATDGAPPQTIWDIVNPGGGVVATNLASVGWAVGFDGTQFTVSAPKDAVPGAGYEVRYNVSNNPQNQSFYGTSALFDVMQTVPLPPTNLTATPADSQITLAWDPVDGAAYFSVYRSLTSGGGYALVQSGIPTPSFTDYGLNDGTRYYYVVTASNAAGESLYSNQASAVPYSTTAAPYPPVNIGGGPGGTNISAWVLYATPLDQAAYLHWAPIPGAISYSLYRKSTSDSYTQVMDGITIANYIDTGLTNGILYTYVVTATNGIGTSDYSLPASVVPGIPPPAPANLCAYPGNGQVSLQWQPAARATVYTVKVGTVPFGPYKRTIRVNGTSFVDTGLQNGVAYFYIVTASDAYGESKPSNQVGAIPTTSRIPLGILPHPPLGIMVDPLALPLWMDQSIPRDSSDAPGGGPSSILGVSLPFGVIEADSGADIVTGDPIVGSLSFGRLYRSAMAAAGLSSPGLPPGWTHNWDYKVVPLQTGVWGPLKLMYPNGTCDDLTFTGDPTGQPSVSFNTIANAPFLVTGVPGSQPGQWQNITLWQNNSAQEIFTEDPSDTVYRLHTVLSDTGAQINLVYAGGLLTNISSSTTSIQSNYSGDSNLWLTYSGGLLQSVSSSTLKSVSYTYDANGELHSVKNLDAPSSDMWGYTYTLVNNMPFLSNVTTPNQGGSSAQVKYDMFTGRVSSLVDAKGNKRTYTYNPGATTVGIGSGTDAYTGGYDGPGRLTSATNAAGNTTAITWQGGEVLTVTPPSAPGVTITRDAQNNPTKITYPHGDSLHLTWNYSSLFPFGQLAQTQECGSDNSSKAPTVFQYYATTGLLGGSLRGHLSSVTYPNGQVVSYTYTLLGDVLSVQTTAADGSTISTQYAYTDSSAGITHYELIGSPRKITDPNGNVTLFPNQFETVDTSADVTDALGNTAHLQLNNNFQLASINVNGVRTTNFSYFVPGKPLTSVNITDSFLGRTVQPLTQTYDAEYGVASTLLDELQTVTPTLDSEFDLTKLLNGNNVTMHSFTDSPTTNSGTYTIGTGSVAATWSSQLDENGNLSSFAGPGYTGNVVWTNALPTDVNWFPSSGGSVFNVHTDYDGFGRVLDSLGGTGVQHSYVYDDEDNVKQDTVNLGFSASYIYAPNGACTSMTVSAGGLSYVYSYSYDKNGNLTAIAVKDAYTGSPIPGAGVSYSYDALDRVTSVRTPQATTLYTYDGFDNVTSLLNLTADSVGVDDPNLTWKEANGTWHSAYSTFTNITYDLQNNRTGMSPTVRDFQTTPSSAIGYSYGTVTYNFGTSNNSTELWSFPSVTGDYRYGLDPGENLGIVRGETFTTDPNSDRFTSSTKTFSGGIGYDLSGNETAFRGFTATYDLAGELRTIQNSARSIVNTFDYDADGLRAKVTSSNTSTTNGVELFNYDGDALVYHFYPGRGVNPPVSESTFYVWGPTGPIQQICNGVAATFTYDPNGSTVARIGYAGVNKTPEWESATLFDAYGLPAWHDKLGGMNAGFPGLTSSAYNPFGYKGQAGYITDGPVAGPYTGEDESFNTGLIYCHHRYYDPYAGRWISRDPTGLDGGENAYEFCDGNPLMGVDPSGLQALHFSDPARIGTSNYPRSLGGRGGTWDPPEKTLYGMPLFMIPLDMLVPGAPLMMGMVEPVLGEAGSTGVFVEAVEFEELGAFKIPDGRAIEIKIPIRPVTTWQEAEAFLASKYGGVSQKFFRVNGIARFVDQFAPNKIGHESKFGFVKMSAGVRRQINADAALVAKKQMSGAVWHFFRSPKTGIGASKSVLKLLKKAGIPVIYH